MKKFKLLLLLLPLIISGCSNTGLNNQDSTKASNLSQEIVGIFPTSVSLSASNVTLVEGKKHDLYATVYPSNASNKEITWTSSNSAVVDVVDGSLFFNGLGYATITATSINGKSASCRVSCVNFVTLTSSLPRAVVFSSGGVNKAAITVDSVNITWRVESNNKTTVTFAVNGRITYKAVNVAATYIGVKVTRSDGSSIGTIPITITGSTTFSASASTTLSTNNGPYNAIVTNYSM